MESSVIIGYTLATHVIAMWRNQQASINALKGLLKRQRHISYSYLSFYVCSYLFLFHLSLLTE